MDYLEAISRRSVSVFLNGQELEVRRANLGLHYRLSVVLDQWQEARRSKDYSMSIKLTIDYVALATGLDIELVKQARPFDILATLYILIALNKTEDALPFMLIEKSKQKYKYDYDHRGLATWVSRLAGHYHWTADYILDGLSPEAAACYLQEAIIDEHADKEFLYRLSEVAYKLEGKGKNARAKYIPFPQPTWMGKEMPKVRIPKAWLPQGNIIDASTFGQRADD
jgi:hypothetical protein